MIRSNQHVVSKDANCVANAEIKYVANAKTKTQLKLICQIFHFAYKIKQNFTIWNVVKTLEITPIFNGAADFGFCPQLNVWNCSANHT